MESFETKKLALIRIYQILCEHSDHKHPLTHEKLIDYLYKEYGIALERKAVARNISLLKEAGYEIETTGQRNLPGVYLAERVFDNCELRFLIDCVASNRFITVRQSRQLIEKLCSQSDKYFRKRVMKDIGELNPDKLESSYFICNISMLNNAIRKKQKVTFTYNEVGSDRKLHPVDKMTVRPVKIELDGMEHTLIAETEDTSLNRFSMELMSRLEVTGQAA